MDETKVLLVQFIAAIQMKILSESSLAILKSKIFRLKYQKALKMAILAKAYLLKSILQHYSVEQ